MPPMPTIVSDVPGSFPWSVFHERHPKLVRQVLDALPYEPAQRVALERLLAESTAGVLEPLAQGTHDAARWREWGRGLWGRPWGEVPFLWAESYFYRRLLDATGYFAPGAWQGVDPFGPFKSAELAGSAVDDELAALGRLRALPQAARAQALLLSALWGNRADLSFQITAGAGAEAGAAGLVADDSAALWAALERADGGGRVCVVADNAGRELLPDLVLIDELLTSGLASGVVLHVKPQPYYVSDATMTDVLAAVARLRAAPGREAGLIGERLWRAMGGGALKVRTHAFFCAPLGFGELPADLRAEFSGAALTIFKGDLNYRRLVGDRHWEATTAFADATAAFPGPVAALRTLKSEVVVGLDARTLEELDATGEAWRTAGTRALVQVR